MACETTLKGPFKKTEPCGLKLLNGLTSILFYSVFGYFANKLKEIYYSERLGMGRSDRRNDTIIAFFKVSSLLRNCIELGKNCVRERKNNIGTFLLFL